VVSSFTTQVRTIIQAQVRVLILSQIESHPYFGVERSYRIFAPNP
jgi:hypothetical protein